MGESVNEQPAEELHKPVIKQCNRRKVSARFKDNIWMADLTEIGSLSSKYENLKYLVCEVDVSTKYALVKTSNEKKGKIVLNVFIKIINIMVNQIIMGLSRKRILQKFYARMLWQ